MLTNQIKETIFELDSEDNSSSAPYVYACDRKTYYHKHFPSKKLLNSEQYFSYLINKFCEKLLKEHIETQDLDAIVRVFAFNNSSFNKLSRSSLRAFDLIKYENLLLLMKHKGVSKCYFIAMNKDSGEVYEESVLFNEDDFNRLAYRLKSILNQEEASDVPRINNNPAFYLCKSCKYKERCFSERE